MENLEPIAQQLKPDTHPFVIEKGYLALTGDATLNAGEITCLLSFSFPSLALKKYSAARRYLDFITVTDSEKPIVKFKNEFTKDKRKRLKIWYVFWYAISAAIAFAPMLFAKEFFGSNWQLAIVGISITLVSFGLLAFFSLDEFGRILRGEELIAMQKIISPQIPTPVPQPDPLNTESTSSSSM